MRIPLARSISARRSSACSSWPTCADSFAASAWRRTATSMAAWRLSGVGAAASADRPRSAAASANSASAWSSSATTGPDATSDSSSIRSSAWPTSSWTTTTAMSGSSRTMSSHASPTDAVHAVTSWPSASSIVAVRRSACGSSSAVSTRSPCAGADSFDVVDVTASMRVSATFPAASMTGTRAPETRRLGLVQAGAMKNLSSESSDPGARAREDRELFQRHLGAGDPAARDELIERFLPLARQLARRYQRAEEPLDDLVQVACIGLIKAIDRFDPSREVAFSSYAVPTILGELKRHFRDRTWSVRVPRDLQELALKVDRAVSELSRGLHRSPTVAEIANAVEANEEQVLEALEAAGAYRATSIDAPRGSDEDAETLGDSMGREEHGFGLAEDRATLARLLDTVTEREREVLRLRFEEDLTQAEIGERIGVSQMQVSRIIRQSLSRLRAAARQPDDDD